MKKVDMEPSWCKELSEYFETTEFRDLSDFVHAEYISKTIYPDSKNIFKAFWLTPFKNVRVVILGQDPYHGTGQAQGLSFSVPTGMKLPPSLKNIYKEIESGTGNIKDYTDGNLESWADQGVLLLNAILTVAADTPASHQKHGWEEFTDMVIKKISDNQSNVVFMLWGKHAQVKEKLIDANKHLVLTAPHPSPFSAHSGFFGCKHFSACNEYLKKNELKEINW